jgi:dCMP deaminase
MIINAGIEKVLYLEGYPDELSLQMLQEAGVELLLVDCAASDSGPKP